MGKWSGLKDKYPPRIDGDTDFLEKVREARTANAASTLPELITTFAAARDEKKQHEETIKKLNVLLEALGQLLLEQLEAQDLISIRTDAGQLLTVTTTPYASVVDRGLLEAYLEKNEDLQYLYTVHPSSLNALVKGLLEEGRDAEMPPGVGVFLKSGISIRKA
jgi:hypothetical protein